MARSQAETRNISKKKDGRKEKDERKVKGGRARGAAAMTSGIVDGGTLEGLKRRAEDLGLIVHAGASGKRGAGGGK